MVNRGDYVVTEQHNYKVIGVLGSVIYLLPVRSNEMDDKIQHHHMTDIEQQFRKIEYVLNNEGR